MTKLKNSKFNYLAIAFKSTWNTIQVMNEYVDQWDYQTKMDYLDRFEDLKLLTSILLFEEFDDDRLRKEVNSAKDFIEGTNKTGISFRSKSSSNIIN